MSSIFDQPDETAGPPASGGSRAPEGERRAPEGGRSRAAEGGESRTPEAREAVPRAWIRLLRAHAELTRRMDASLRAAHGLTLREYEILLALGEAPGGRLRRVDLAGMVLVSQSGVTRLLEPLERRGLVDREASAEDRRVTYARLTGEGRERWREAQRSHRADIRELFAERFSSAELEVLDELLERLPGAAGESEWRSGSSSAKERPM